MVQRISPNVIVVMVIMLLMDVLRVRMAMMVMVIVLMIVVVWRRVAVVSMMCYHRTWCVGNTIRIERIRLVFMVTVVFIV